MGTGQTTSGRTPELLAPAGGREAAYAALQHGADAVYLGLKEFSARADAVNFTPEEAGEVAAYAHGLSPRRRVFVAVNTLVLDAERSDAVGALAAASDAGADAVIVQDLGVARIVRRQFPGLELHASTQLAVHDLAGVEALAAIGFRRVTVARELTLKEIRSLCRKAPAEIEVFVHGALCYSASGLCLFSSHVTGRSANRGRCAQPCRVAYFPQAPGNPHDGRENFTSQILNPNGVSNLQSPISNPHSPRASKGRRALLFSMKDLALPDHALALREAGVACLKIEGRKKSPLYVAAVTDFYRRILDGTLPHAELPEAETRLRTVFSRPWTKLYLDGPAQDRCADPDFSGHRGAPLGIVEALVPGGAGETWIRFRTARPLERRDGLQVEIPGVEKPFGFSVEKMRPAGTEKKKNRDLLCEAPAGAKLEILLPVGHLPIPEGSEVFCSSSQAVKRRFRWEVPAPGTHRPRPEAEVAAVLSASSLRVSARAPMGRGRAASASGELPGPFDPARDPAEVERMFRDSFGKLGDTPFAPGAVRLENPEGLFVPVSRLNALRRVIFRELETALGRERAAALEEVREAVLAEGGEEAGSAAPDRQDAPPVSGARPSRGREAVPARSPERRFLWSVKTERFEDLDGFEDADWADAEEAVVVLGASTLPALDRGLEVLAGRIGRDRIRLALPPVIRPRDAEALADLPERLIAEGWTRWEIANVSGFARLGVLPADPMAEIATKRANVSSASTLDPPPSTLSPKGVSREVLGLSADWPVYAMNRSAALQILEMGARRFTLSPEDGRENMKAVLDAFGDSATVIVYQVTPLFLSETCPRATLAGGCPGRTRCRFEEMELGSDFGNRLRVMSRDCRTVVVERSPFSLTASLGELAAAGAVRLRVDLQFLDGGAREAAEIWRKARRGEAIPGSHEGNFRRGLA